MLDVVVAVNNEEVLENNLLRSPLLKNAGVTLQLQKGYRSASVAYNCALSKCHNELVVFAHQDVYIPRGWEGKVVRNTAYLDKTDPSWAVLGVYGVTKSAQQIGYVWSSGLNRFFGAAFDDPALVDSIDELLIIVKRSSGISFDENLEGFHLYGTDLVQTALAINKTAYAICAPVIHNSVPRLYLNKDYFDAYTYVANKWKGKLPIHNCVATIVGSVFFKNIMILKHALNKLRYSSINRKALDRKYDCIELAKNLGFE